jgi:putative ABC transport system permease protein
MLDGLIMEDSNPYDSDLDETHQEEIKAIEQHNIYNKKTRKEKNKTSMSFFTALSLSLKNLNTKKGRTILTSFAGSIGIIGIAMILAITSGINAYIDTLTVDTLATNPISITSTGFDIDEAMNVKGVQETMEKFPSVEKVFVKEAMNMDNIIKQNLIDEYYINYLKNNIKPEWVNDIAYGTSHDINIFGIKKDETNYSNLMYDKNEYGSISKIKGFSELGSINFTAMQYQAIHGELPKNKNELVVIVDEYNRIQEESLLNLGYKTIDDNVTEFDFSELVGKEFKVATNNFMYEKKLGSKVNPITLEETQFEYFEEIVNKDYDNCEPLTIVGIVRLRPELESGILSSGIGYTRELSQWVLDENMSSKLVAWINNNPTISPMSKGNKYYSPIYTPEELLQNELRKYGGITAPNDIQIYPVDFDAKENILTVLDSWNEQNTEHIVTYTDFAAILSSVITQMVNYISFALIAFTAISLLVSSVMIGIITYVSVLERTKEIGILRAIGARKKDITRVFNAETFLIGLLAGFIGVVFTYIISIPLNIIVYELAEVKQLAQLPVYQALILIVVSVALTVISGLIPAFKAAKKDPVLALRTE